MSQERFQAELARLLLEADFRDRVRADGERALDGELTPVERRRLVAVARDPGLGITRTLHDGWRLSKVLLMLPLTCVVLGNDRLALELREFWPTRVPRSLYFLEEAIAFCDHLQAKRPDRRMPSYLDEIVAFERATLVLRRPWAPGPPSPQQVAFRHDPEQLLETVAAGRRPRGIPLRPCLLVGGTRAPGQVEWRIAELPEAPTVAETRAPGESLALTPAIS
jgi:hypothetical protein